MTTRQNIIWGGLSILLFLGALLWAKEQDPFSRNWFTLKTPDHSSFKCVAVLPKPMRQYPVIIYVHGSGGSLMSDGVDLRQMAELNLATLSLEYDQTNGTGFAAQFETLLRYLERQNWAKTNAIAWVGDGLGANQILDFALRHPEQQPQLLVLLSGAGLREGQANSHMESLHCPFLLIHDEKDQIFPVADAKRLAILLQTNKLAVELKIISGLQHDMEPERSVVFRSIGEYSRSHLVGKNAWQNYHSIARWEAEAPSLWLFWLPAVTWIAAWFACWQCRKAGLFEEIKLDSNIKVMATKASLTQAILGWLAAFLTMWALAETAIHLVPPHFPVSDKTLAIARQILVQPKESADFEFLAGKPIWQAEKLKTLLDQVELAGYNRELINWKLDDKIYRWFVLSPVITDRSGEQLNWRRPLWEEFYPRIRHESSLEDAAKIVVRHLRERVTITALPNSPQDVPSIWLKQITDEAGFEIIYVAALRSVGVPARLNSQGQAELFANEKWQAAPRSVVASQ